MENLAAGQFFPPITSFFPCQDHSHQRSILIFIYMLLYQKEKKGGGGETWELPDSDTFLFFLGKSGSVGLKDIFSFSFFFLIFKDES